MAKIGLIAFATAILLTGAAGYAAEKVAFTCSGTLRVLPEDEKGSSLNTSLVVDLDKGVVTGEVGWCHFPCSFSIAHVSETEIEFKGQSEQGRMDRITGSLFVTESLEDRSWTGYEATCKPTKPLF
jgi:hypothetical protein